MTKNTAKRAFTLIELLTVIAIIGILAAILIPVVGAVRHSARSSQSLSNLRQIGMGVSLFTTEYNDTFPLLNRRNTDPDGPQFFWVQSLEELLFDWDRHASGTIQKHPIFADPTVEAGKGHPISDYGANGRVFLDANSANAARAENGLKLSAIREPTMTAVVATSHHPNTGSASWYVQAGFVTGAASNSVPEGRLNSGAIGLVFADGHVETIDREIVFNDRTARQRIFDPNYWK